MPAIVLTRVDLPAPLSPTRPTTSHALTSKSMLFSACTGPNRLLTPFSWSRDPLEFMVFPFSRGPAGDRPGGANAAPPGRLPSSFGHAIPFALQAAANAAVQIWLAVQNPSLTIVPAMFDFVTATGVRIVDGTFFWPLLVVPLIGGVGGFWPLDRATAIVAAAGASSFTALYTVMNCWPARIRWTAASSASCPVVGLADGWMPADVIAAIAPPAVPSLAAYTPWNPLLPSAVIACCISV